MSKAAVVRPYVEKLVAEFCETDNLVIDENGDIPVRKGSALYIVRLLDQDPPLVQIYSVLVAGVKQSEKLLERINEINTDSFFGRTFLVDDRVILATELLAETLDKVEMENACLAIGNVADKYDTALKAEFGGETSYEDEPATVPASDSEEDA